MGQGSAVTFNDILLQMGKAEYDLPSGGDAFKVALITNAVVPLKTDATPELADYTECSGGTYAAQAVANQDYTLSANETDFVGDSVTFAQDAVSGPQDCYYAVLYKDTAPYKCLQFWDLTEDGGTTPLSLRDAPIVINFGSGTRSILTGSIPANA